MRRFLWIGAWLCAAFLAAPASALRIVTTTPDLASVAQEIAGESAEVSSIAKGTQDPHYVDAKPSFIRRVNRADVLIFTGMELEIGWLPTLVEKSRNRNLTPGSSRLINASEAIEEKLEAPEEGKQLSRSDGDVHPEGNPHYMLDPRSGLAVAEYLAERLSEIDPERSETYRANLKAFQETLQKRIEDWEARLESWRGKKVVAYHATWSYTAEWLGIDVIAHVEEKPGIPPGPRHLATLDARLKNEKIAAVIAASHLSPKLAQAVAKRAGVRFARLPMMVGAEKEVKSYIDLIEAIAVQFEELDKP